MITSRKILRIVSLAASLNLLGSCFNAPTVRAQIEWNTDLATAKTRASDEQKDLLVFVTAKWSPPDRRLKTTVLETPEFRKATESFVLVELEYTVLEKLQESESPEVAMMMRLRVTAFPTIIVADEKGRAVASFAGYFGKGPPVFLAHLDFLRQTRIRRDEWLASANEATGLDRARKLDRALSLLPSIYQRADYADLIAEIVELDSDNGAGLKQLYSNPPPDPLLKKDAPTPEEIERLQETVSQEQQSQRLLGEGKFAEAIEFTNKSWQTRHEILGPYHSATAASLTDLGVLHFLDHQLEKAEQHIWNALVVLLASLREQHSQTLHCLTRLAFVLTCREDC